MPVMCRFLSCLAVLIAGLQPAWPAGSGADAAGFHVLKNRIVRSLAIDAEDPRHILAGQKAKKPGSALVFQSLDGGRSWRTLNGNASLHPKATDVQAVLAVSKDVLLAGTWKYGLYRSGNGGKSFSRIIDFPSTDIRDLLMRDDVVYAATARHGVFESRDGGQSWTGLGPGSAFLWSLTVAGKSLYASSPEKAVYQRGRDEGGWQKIFTVDGANAIALTPDSGGLRAIAGAKGLHISATSGWRLVLKGQNVADVIITRNNRIIAGTWGKGVTVLMSDGNVERTLLPGISAIHVQIAGGLLYIGTWGDGLHVKPLASIY